MQNDSVYPHEEGFIFIVNLLINLFFWYSTIKFK